MSPTDTVDLALQRDLGRLEGKVDAIQKSATNIETNLQALEEAHNMRLAALEKRQWYITGAAAAAAWIASSFLDLRALLGRLL
ncbi:hypothetical protein [Xanthobacter aminoxidans]|uniref:hypothetical protein n=1 Tax=Xanthobacter aminoxidans TaxID=186280 RepID=UPI0020231133|nr:hypothetical protein [Xanthobacter aminoxidans]MCL8384164.1 hypothetical protein [Xanthobacter aminoxidans]